MPRKRFGFGVQLVFDLFIENSGLFENIIRTKDRIVVIYDPSDELINFHCSAYIGIIFLFNKLYNKLRKNKTKLRTKNKPGLWNFLVTLPGRLRSTEKDVNLHLGLFKRVEPLLSRENVAALSQALFRVFNLIRNVDINSYMEDSVRLCRSSSSRYNLGDIVDELDQFLQLGGATRNGQSAPARRPAAETYDYNLQDLLAALEDFDNGLKEIFIKFVKFTNRLSACSLSLFDIYYMKRPDPSFLIIFLWTVQFMEEMTLLDGGHGQDLRSKYDAGLLTMCSLNRPGEL